MIDWLTTRAPMLYSLAKRCLLKSKQTPVAKWSQFKHPTEINRQSSLSTSLPSHAAAAAAAAAPPGQVLSPALEPSQHRRSYSARLGCHWPPRVAKTSCKWFAEICGRASQGGTCRTGLSVSAGDDKDSRLRMQVTPVGSCGDGSWRRRDWGSSYFADITLRRPFCIRVTGKRATSFEHWRYINIIIISSSSSSLSL